MGEDSKAWRRQWEKESKDLAEGVSTQAQISNKAWLAMMSVAAFAVLPHDAATVTLPLGFGTVPKTLLFAAVYPLLLILVVAFSSAHAQQLNAQNFAQSRMNELAHELGRHEGVGDRTMFDLCRKPSMNRVVPLVRLLRNEWRNSVNLKYLNKVARFYYWLLKVFAQLVYFVLPGIALWYAFAQLPFTGLIRWLFGLGGLISSISLIQVIAAEFNYAKRAAKHA